MKFKKNKNKNENIDGPISFKHIAFISLMNILIAKVTFAQRFFTYILLFSFSTIEKHNLFEYYSDT